MTSCGVEVVNGELNGGRGWLLGPESLLMILVQCAICM
jgi:hypothetical protein